MAEQKVVVITGASGGIARAAARAFGARGDRVALLARGEAGLAGAKHDIESGGGQALSIPTDVARVGAGLDTLHAVTMLALATRSSTWRRPALGSAVVAATFAVQALGDAQRLPPTTGASLRPIAGTAAGLLDRLLDLRDRCALTVLHAAPPVVDGVRTHRGGVR